MTREEALAMRLSCQQLVDPRFDSPEEVVDWMGMVQAQDYSHFRWAIGTCIPEIIPNEANNFISTC